MRSQGDKVAAQCDERGRFRDDKESRSDDVYVVQN